MNPLHLIWIIPLAASVGFLIGTLIKVSNYGIVDLPFWMWEKIVRILSECDYSGAAEIVEAIKERMK
jgi:hypothetical protein